MKYPFLFRLIDHVTEDALDKWVVKIAAPFDYTFYNSRWMCDEVLGDTCLVPDVDLSAEVHHFTSEEAAIKFIKGWWAKQ